MVLNAHHSQPLPPSGMEHAVALHLVPPHSNSSPSSSSRASHRGQIVSHIVTARDDVLNVYEVRRKTSFTGGVEKDAVYHVRSHRIFGSITGLGKCDVDASSADGKLDNERETLVISFKDAKLALMQWSDAAADLVTISIHTYERAPQLAEGVLPQFRPLLRIDPDSRCAALLLPHDALAILPFYHDTAEELDELLERAGGVDGADAIALETSLPYAPSFVLSLISADPTIKNVRDFVFLPHFQRPTVAVLFEANPTWTGRLDERNDTCSIRIITLDLTTASDASHRVISSKDGLPFDSHYLTACPQSVGGGVLITSSSALIHMDQGGRIVGTAVSGWHAFTSKLPLPRWKGKATDAGGNRPKLENGAATNGINGLHNGTTHEANPEKELAQLCLANSHIIFPDPSSSSALLVLEDGSTWLVNNALEGRSLSAISLEDRGTTVQPSLATVVSTSDLLLIGSMVGDAHLLRARPIELKRKEGEDSQVTNGIDDDMDLDADLYGDTANTATSNGAATSSRAKLDFDLQVAAIVPQLGPILHSCPVVTGDAGALGGLAQTLLCNGARAQGGLTLLEPQIVPRSKRQLALNATNGLWTIRTDEDSGNVILLSSNADGSEIATANLHDAMVSVNVPLKGRTVYACSASGQHAPSDNLIVRVTETHVFLIRESGEEVQSIRLRHKGNKGTSSSAGDTIDVYTAEYSATLLTVLWTDGTLQMFRFRASKLEWVNLPDDIQGRKYVAAGLIVDRFDTFRKHKSATQSQPDKGATLRFTRGDDDDEVDYGEDVEIENDGGDEVAQAAGKKGVWIALTSSEACLQLYSWPDLQCVWQSNSLYPAPSRLDYVANASEEEEVPSLELSQVQLCHVGDVLHLAVAFQNGLVNVYEANANPGDDDDTLAAYSEAKSDVLALSFVKVLAKQLDVVGAGMLSAPNGDSTIEGLSLRAFDSLNGLSGLFVGGVAPCWLLREHNGPAYLHMSAEQSMDHLCVLDDAAASGEEASWKGSFAYVQYGIVNFARMPLLDFSLPVAHRRKARTQRTYTNATAHPLTRTIVASSVVEQQFVLFDPEDGHVVEDPNADPTVAKAARSALELFVDEDGEPVDGYEFQQCEVVSSIELVTLRSVGSMSGLKDYIAIGTVISHGEDRPARGAVYIFDVVEIVAPQHDPVARFRLRLLVRDDCKGPITNITDMNGYLVIVMGLKLFVRSLEKDEWLITVAFLDVPFQTTSLQRLKNFLLLTDVHRSVWFIAFQEEPYRLVVISKDYNAIHQSCGSFMIRDQEMTIVCSSHDGVLRLYDYAPTIPASQGGQRLLIRSEYANGSEASCRTVIPGPASNDGGIATSNEVLFGLMNGALQLLQPVDEEIFNVLHLLQGQLVRTIPHFAGLNPRAYRVVPNETVSRPLTKGVLDGTLLATFEMLSRPKMEEIAKLIPDLVDGADQLLRYIATLRSSWGAL